MRDNRNIRKDQQKQDSVVMCQQSFEPKIVFIYYIIISVYTKYDIRGEKVQIHVIMHLHVTAHLS